MNLSKSKYCALCQCAKNLWLRKFKPEELVIDEATKDKFVKGNEVGDLAMGLFGEFTEVTSKKEDGSLDLAKMIELTKECLEKGVENICEASFSYKGLYCAVDILRKDGGGYSIYEVKSSTEVKATYIDDVSYQKYVLEKCGVNVLHTNIVYINNKYVRGDELDIKGLFTIENVDNLVKKTICNVEPNLKIGEEVLSSDVEPNIDIGPHCFDPYECGFWKYCSKHLPEYSVFNLYRLSKTKAFEYYRKGVISFEDVKNAGWFLSPHIDRQIDYNLNDKGVYIDKEEIKNFLDTLSYPLYFLDFETMQPVVPEFKGTKPYQQIPFQYSLHYIENEGAELKHKEFLAVSGENPLRSIAESLCENIPDNVCVLAYNKSFECTRLRELAEMFPDLSKHLMAINMNMKDLLDPFQAGYYYRKEIGGSFSIKSVLPAMFPGDPELNYHNLDGVHNGGEAMTIFPEIKNMEKSEQEIWRHNLLKYCELDTYAMVKIWQELMNIIKV